MPEMSVWGRPRELRDSRGKWEAEEGSRRLNVKVLYWFRNRDLCFRKVRIWAERSREYMEWLWTQRFLFSRNSPPFRQLSTQMPHKGTVYLPLEKLDKCSHCNKRQSGLLLCSACGEVMNYGLDAYETTLIATWFSGFTAPKNVNKQIGKPIKVSAVGLYYISIFRHRTHGPP